MPPAPIQAEQKTSPWLDQNGFAADSATMPRNRRHRRQQAEKVRSSGIVAGTPALHKS
jgi:hypothetical protein